MRIKKLSSSIIRDLTTPRYIEKIGENSNDGRYKVIVDTHCYPVTVISPKFTMDSDLTENIDELNSDYHNHVAKHLGFDLNLGVELARINRGSW